MFTQINDIWRENINVIFIIYLYYFVLLYIFLNNVYIFLLFFIIIIIFFIIQCWIFVSKPNDKRQHKQDFIKSSRDRNSQI